MGVHNVRILSNQEEGKITQRRRAKDEHKKKSKTARKVARKSHKTNLLKGK